VRYVIEIWNHFTHMVDRKDRIEHFSLFPMLFAEGSKEAMTEQELIICYETRSLFVDGLVLYYNMMQGLRVKDV